MLGRFRLALAGLLLTSLVAFAADGPIRLPVAPVVPTPMPTPGGVVTLPSDAWYVIESDVECSVRSYPRGLVKVTKEVGPLRLKGVFAGGTGKVEMRAYKGPHLYVVEAVGKGAVELEVIPLGFKSEAEIVGASLVVDAGATSCPDKPPAPKPVDPVVPPDKPPAPKPVDPVVPKVETFRVVLVYESSKPMTAAQVGVVYGKEIEQYLTATCTKDGANNGWRRHDKDDAATGDTETFNAMWARAKAKVAGVPCVVVEVNGVPSVIPVPADAAIADVLASIKKLAGGK